MYLGSAALFLVNIAIGILNVFTEGEPSHAQILAHFHAGTIGWVTLSVIATAVWAFTGVRIVSDRYARFTQALTTVGVLAVAGYIVSFWLAFSGNGPFALLPAFGIPTALVIWGAFGLTWAQLRHQPVLSTVHVLLFSALLVVSVGAAMGILWGLTYSTGINPYPAGGSGIAAHAAPMDMYLALAFAAIAELLLRGDHGSRWTRPGMTQAVLGVAGGLLAIVALFVGIGPLVPIAMLAFLVGFGFYMVRTGWRAFTVNPASRGRSAALFWGGLAFPVYIVLFAVFVLVYFVPEKPIPHALEVTFAHVTFVGMATNLLLAQHASFTDGSPIGRRLEPIGLWTLNIGLLAFIAGEALGGRKEGALVMALGVLLALGTVVARLWNAQPPSSGAPEAQAGP